MREKGFTLTEIIISIAILASIGLTIVFGLNRIFGNQAAEDKILSSTDLYLSNNQHLINELQSEIVI